MHCPSVLPWSIWRRRGGADSAVPSARLEQLSPYLRKEQKN